MTTGLPAREFHQLAAPEGGALAVRREARRRQRRRAVLVSGCTAVVVAATGLLLHAGGPSRRDSLQVADDPTTSASSSPQPAASGAARPSASATPGPSGSAAPVVTGGPAERASTQPQADQPAGVTAYRTPDLTRAYSDRSSFGSVSFCTGSASGSQQSGVQATVSWCPSATVTGTARGHDLVGTVCRDGSSAATLSFATQQEVELTVQRADGTVVWRWSTGHGDAADQHVLAVEADHCWSWTAPWTDVDARGRALSGGSYELVVSSRADELRTAPVATVGFTL